MAAASVNYGSGGASAIAATTQPIPYPGRYVVVKQFAIDQPDIHPLPDMAPLHNYNPYYLRLDLKTHSTRLLHNAIQQTSVDATPEHHVTVVSGLVAAGVLPDNTLSPSSSSLQILPPNQRSCSIASAGKKVAFAETVLVCSVDDDDDNDDQISVSGGERTFPPLSPPKPESKQPEQPPVTLLSHLPQRSLFNVLQVYSQTGELVGDVLIERPHKQLPLSTTPSPVNDTEAMSSPVSLSLTIPPLITPPPIDDTGRRKRHEMFCRRRQSPVYSCDDGEAATTATSTDTVVPVSPDDGQHSVSSSSVYESCEELSIVVLGTDLGQPQLPLRHHSHHRSAAAVRGYASCCPL